MASFSVRKSFVLLRYASSRSLSTLSLSTNIHNILNKTHVKNPEMPLIRTVCNWCRVHHSKTLWNKTANTLTVTVNDRNILTAHRTAPSDQLVPVQGLGVYIQQRYVGTVAEKVKKIPLAKSIPLKRVRKKHIEEPEDSHVHKNVVAYAVGEELDLQSLRNKIELENVYSVVKLPLDVTDAFMVTANFKLNGRSREAFFFSDGGIACWHMSETERHELWKLARSHAENPYDVEMIQKEQESLSVLYDSASTKLVGGIIHLKALASVEEAGTDTEIKLHKYTFSNALTQSVNLSISEANLQTFIEELEPETQKLRYGKKSKISKKQINMQLGEVFSLRHEINLESGFLDVPDIYWEREELEGIYREMISYLSMPKRVKVLNERLNYCSEILQLFNSQLSDQHHVRLEWIIIILILIEVIFECFHYAERFGIININNEQQARYDAVDQQNSGTIPDSLKTNL